MSINSKLRKEGIEIKTIQVQVHVENEPAIQFYKKFGFKQKKCIEKAYHHIRNKKAFLFELQVK